MSRINPFDSISGDDLLIEKVRRLADVVDELEQFLPFLRPVLNKLKENRAPSIEVFPAAITSFQQFGSVNRWKYAWAEVKAGGFYPPSGANLRSSQSGTSDSFTLPAYNGLETDNQIGAGGNGVDGVGIKLGDMLGADGVSVVATSKMMPIGFNGTDVSAGTCTRKQIVLMMELPYEVAGARHWFTASNAITVECAGDG